MDQSYVYFLSLKDNIIYLNCKDGRIIPDIRLKQNFPDNPVMNGTHIEYMNRYMSMFPHLFEKIQNIEKPIQLCLF